MKKNVLMTGGSGFIGKKMTDLLIENGFLVSILTRSDYKNTTDISYYKWNLDSKTMDENAVLNADYILHLAGEGIAEKRWTTSRKKAIVDSRVDSIQLIYNVLKKNNITLKAFISASGVGIYGAFNSEIICDEETLPANDFLGNTCVKWEQAVDFIGDLNIRTVKIRTGLVMGKNDGFLKKLIPVFKYKLGSVLGSGKQYMPWIHVDDLCQMYLQAIQNDLMFGAYNGAINDATNNEIFSKTLANCFGYKIWLPKLPAFFIKLLLGEMSQILLTGQRVSSDKIEKAGFVFKYKILKEVLVNCLLREG
jgi:uncharacterized protein